MAITFLKQPAPVELSGNAIKLRIAGSSAYVNNVLRDFYRIGVRIEENEVEIVSVELPVGLPVGEEAPAGSGVVQLIIQDVLKKEVVGHFTFPEPDTGLNFTHNILRLIRVYAYEKYGVPPVNQPGEYTPVFRVLQGKLDLFEEGFNNYLQKTWWETQVETPRFLTAHPGNKLTDIYSPERLYAIFPEAGTYKLKVREYYQDIDYDEAATVTQQIFKSNFANWVSTSDPAFVWQPYGMTINSPDTGITVYNYNDKLRVIIPYDADGTPKVLYALFNSPNNVLAAGKYVVNIDIESITGGTVTLLSSAGDTVLLTQGENNVELTFTDYAFLRIQFYNEGDFLVRSITINQTTQLASEQSEYVALFTKATFTVEAFEIKEFLTSHYKLCRNGSPTVVKYKVMLTDNADNVICDFMYRMDYRYQYSARYYMFLNKKYGVYEIVRTTGKGQNVSDIRKSTVKIPLPVNFTGTTRGEKQIKASEETTSTVNSGYFRNQAEADWFRSFRESSDVYQLKKGQAYPIHILDSKSILSDNDNFNLPAEFSYIHALGDTYSDEIKDNIPVRMGSFNIDFNSDFEIGTSPVPPPTPVLFYNDLQQRDFTRNNCANGYFGTVVRYTVPAGKYSSDTKAKANQKALDEIDAQGQAYANANGTCELTPVSYFYNTRRSVTISKNDCGGISEGSQVEYVVEAGKHKSTVSQAEADALAQADIDNNAQAYANQFGSCVWYNQAKTASAQKSGCTPDKYGSTVEMSVTEGQFSSTVSYADANAQADAYLTANKQAYADANGTCIVRDSLSIIVEKSINVGYYNIFFKAPTGIADVNLYPDENKTVYKGIQYSITPYTQGQVSIQGQLVEPGQTINLSFETTVSIYIYDSQG